MNRFRAGVLIAFGSFMLVTFLLIAGFFIRAKRPYYLDIVFNMTKEHVSYETGTRYRLPLPRRVTWGYRTSDNSCVYRTEMTLDELISWYEDNGYIVEENRIYENDKNDWMWYTVEYRDNENSRINSIVITRHVKYYNYRIDSYSYFGNLLCS